MQYFLFLAQILEFISLQTNGLVEDDKVKGDVEVVAVVVGGLHELHNFAQKVEKGSRPMNELVKQYASENELQILGFLSRHDWLEVVVVIKQLLQDFAQYTLNGIFSTLVPGIVQ